MLVNRFYLVLITLLLVIQNSSISQTFVEDTLVMYNSLAESSFLEGLKLYQMGKYDTSASIFLRVAKELPRNQRTTAAYVMAGKALCESNKPKESIKLLKDFIDIYSSSNYLDDAHYTLAIDYSKLGRFEDCANELINVINSSSDVKLLKRSKKMLTVVVDSQLTMKEVEYIRSDIKNIEIGALLDLALAKKHISAGDIVSAMQLLRRVTDLPPNIEYVQEALTLLEKLEKESVITIGIMLPLMLKSDNPSAKMLGLEFFQGIKMAFDEYNQTANVKIAYDLRDTERNLSVAARHVSDLCNNEAVRAIIGPLLSNEVFACAGISNERGVPLITPTANANGISAIGPYIFQANPDFNMRGKAMAIFAFHALKARTFCVLSPKDDISKQIVNSFVNEIDSLGGKIIDVQWYISGAGDIRSEIADLRQRALEKLEVPVIDFSGKIKQAELNKIVEWGVEQRVLDSLVERRIAVPVTSLFGERGIIIADSLKLPMKHQKIKYDSLELAVKNIDAIFIPISSADEIPVVSSQLKYFNIQTQILGTGEWNELNILDQNRQYTDGVIFTADSYYDTTDVKYRSFILKYKELYNAIPGENAFLGYDVAKLLTHVIAMNNYKRSDIANALSTIEGYRCLHNKISLSLNRVNSCLNLVQYKNRKIYKIGEVDIALLGKSSIEAPKK